MNKTLIAAVAGVAALALVGVGLWTSRPDPATDGDTDVEAGPPPDLADADAPPNVLIILWDTVRADRMSLYGYDLDTTPRVANWATSSGVVYERAVSPAMWTIPSHASMFTGLAPTTHGAALDHRHLDDENHTLAEHFQANGYQTYAFSANPNLSPKRVNLLQGFDHIDLSWGKRWKRKVVAHTKEKLVDRDASTEISPGNPNRTKGVGFYNAGPITHEAFGQFLDERTDRGIDKPFFAYLSYMEAHKPRVPAMTSRQLVDDPAGVELGLSTDLTFLSQLLYSYDKKSYTDAELEAVNRVYDATLKDLDEATGDLLDDLEARGVLDNTIVVFTADHGEQLGEHQLFGHRNAVYQALLHVPLVIAYPKSLKPTRVDTPVTNLDLYNTIIELAGLPLPDGDFKRGNLADLSKLAVQALFSESISFDAPGFKKVAARFTDMTLDVYANKYRAVVKGDWKLIQTVDFDDESILRHELYHVSEDPHEETDLSESETDRVAELTSDMATWRKGLRTHDGGQVVEDAPMTLAECENLKMLGYFVGDCEEEVGG